MSRFSRFLPPLLIACAVFTGAVDLLHRARVRGEIRKLTPPAQKIVLAHLIPPPLLPPARIPPPPLLVDDAGVP
jgi:hypothetical protein